MSADDQTPDDVPSRFQVDFTGRTLLGNYRVEKRLAEGGMGAVYLAEDTNLGRRVVVKVPHTRFLGEPGFKTRFRREITELVRLEHPHVVRILARGEEDEVPFFVLQFLGGGSLEDHIAKGREAPAEAPAWLLPIAKTLDYIHGQGVVHRDVKPANILFDERGHVFLSDFGVVKALGADDGGEKTEVGTGIGSPFYMAPEQAVGGAVGPASDQYALASSLYEALVGEPPFKKGTLIEVMLKKQREDAPSILASLPHVPAPCDVALRRALDRDPANRFASCTEFATAFAEGVAPASSGAFPAGRSRRAAVAGGLVLLFAVGVATRGFGAFPAKPAPPVVSLRPAGEILVLAERGAEPRKAYRWKLAAGAEDKFTLATSFTLKQTLTGEKGYEGSSSYDRLMEVKVTGVDADGRASADWTFGVARAVAAEGETSGVAANEQKMYDAIGVITAKLVTSPLGGASAFSLNVKPNLPARTEGMVGGMEEWVRSMCASLPEEPIGVGAIWDHTRAAKVIGVRFQQTTSFELTKVEGDRLFLKVHGEQNAMPQGFRPPGFPPGLTSTMKVFRSVTDGELVVDLTKPAPERFTSKGSVHFEATVTGEAAPKDAMLGFDATFEGRIRRDK